MDHFYHMPSANKLLKIEVKHIRYISETWRQVRKHPSQVVAELYLQLTEIELTFYKLSNVVVRAIYSRIILQFLFFFDVV